MVDNENRLRETLTRIAELVRAAVEGDEYADRDYGNGRPTLVCTLKTLPTRLLVKAAHTATRINSVNAPVLGPLADFVPDLRITEPEHIAVLTSKYWAQGHGN
jgi:hypothetical protein